MGEYRTGDEETSREYVGGSPETFRGNYSIHDVGEQYLLDCLADVATTVDVTGNIDKSGGGPRSDPHSTPWDLEADGVKIDVKTTKYPEYLGNVREYHWNEYPPGLWIACFVIDGGGIVETGAYRKDRVAVTGRNDGANGETFVEPRPVQPLFELFRAVAANRGGR